METLEDKVSVLRHVALFEAMSEAVLMQIAATLDLVSVQSDVPIVTKGELGECMYIIIDGQVRAHDGDLVFNDLGVGAVFGEMAVLDAEVRSATITALVPTTLFRLGQQPLYALLDAHPQIAHGIISILCQHLRNRIHDLTEDYEYMRLFAQLTTAAQAIETGTYTPAIIDEVRQRTDPLGQLARVFQHMAHEVQDREQRLQQQVIELRIEIDQARQQHHVAEITGTDYFRNLQQAAALFRAEVDRDQGDDQQT